MNSKSLICVILAVPLAVNAADVAHRSADPVSCNIRLRDVHLRLPLKIFGRFEYCRRNRAEEELESVPGFFLKFPEMTPGRWIPEVDRIPIKGDTKRPYYADAFPLWIKYIYSPQNYSNTEDWSGPNPQLRQIKANRATMARLSDSHLLTMRSRISGLRKMVFIPNSPASAASAVEAIGDARLGILTEPVGADYELFLECDDLLDCEGFVQLNESHVQYRFVMPFASVDHAGEVVRSLNHVISSWIVR